MRKVIMNHCFQNLLLQSGMVMNSRVMAGSERTQRILFRSLSGTENTLFCSGGMMADNKIYVRSSGHKQVTDSMWTIHDKNARKKCFQKHASPSGISLRPCRLRERWEYPESSWKIPLSVLERPWTRKLVSSCQPIRGCVSIFSTEPELRQVQQGLTFIRTNSLMRRSKHRTTM